MDCIEARDRADEAAYGLLDGAEQAAFESHLRGCPSCIRLLDEARERRTLLRSVRVVPVPAGLADRVLRRRRPWPRWAAAAALVLALGGLVWNVGRRPGFEAVGAGARVRGEERIPFANRIALAAGDLLRTQAGESATIRFPDGSTAAVRENARVSVAMRRLGLEAGEVECRVIRGAERFVVATPAGEVIVLGTQFVVRYGGETEMNRARAAGAGAVLSVAVVTGAVLVSNSRGEVTLGPGDSAVAAAGEAPRKTDEAGLERMESERQALEKESETLQARVDDLSRAGREMLLRLRERESSPAPAAKAAGKSPDDMMRATMKLAMKAQVKTLVDKLERKLQLTPEQRKVAETAYLAMMDKLVAAMFEGDEAFQDNGHVDEALLELGKHLRPDQQEGLRRMQEEEAQAGRKAAEESQAKAFAAAAADLRLTDDQRARMAAPLGEKLQSVQERSAMLYVKVMMGRMKMEEYRTRNQALVQESVESLREGLTADQVEALKKHLEKITAPGAMTRVPVGQEGDK